MVLEEINIKYNAEKNYYEVLIEQENNKSLLIFNIKNINFDGWKMIISGNAMCEELHHATLTGIRPWDDK